MALSRHANSLTAGWKTFFNNELININNESLPNPKDNYKSECQYSQGGTTPERTIIGKLDTHVYSSM